MRATAKRHVQPAHVEHKKAAEPAKVKAEAHHTGKKEEHRASHYADHAKGHEKLHATETKTSKSIDFGAKALAGKTLVAQLESALPGAVPSGTNVEVKK